MVCFKYCSKHNTNFMKKLRKRQLYRFRDIENVFDLKINTLKKQLKKWLICKKKHLKKHIIYN